jgi:hypothetical protein
MSLLPLVKSVAAAVLAVVLIVGCGDPDSAGTDSTVPSAPTTTLPTLSEWCATYQLSLPALSSPNPDGHELEVLELTVARYSLLASGAPGVPASATNAMADLARFFRVIRDRVADGERLPDVLMETFANDQSDLIVAGTKVDAEVTAVCS